MDSFLKNAGIGLIAFIAIFCATSGLHNVSVLLEKGINTLPAVVQVGAVVGFIAFIVIALVKTAVES